LFLKNFYKYDNVENFSNTDVSRALLINKVSNHDC
jgi:hypothetical protein